MACGDACRRFGYRQQGKKDEPGNSGASNNGFEPLL
jgi:hypothetical protein